jgi:hypothetical protein
MTTKTNPMRLRKTANEKTDVARMQTEVGQRQTDVARDERFLSDHDLSVRWKCAAKTLRNQRSQKVGCPYVHLGRLVRYRLSDVLAYEARGECAQ